MPLSISRSILYSVAAALGAALIILVISSKYGIGISPDSACYISIAENVNDCNGYAIYDLEPAVAWPPLYPTLLAIGKYLNLDYKVWARVLGVFLFGLLVYMVSIQIFVRLRNPALQAAAILAVVLSTPLIHVSQFAWSESLFILLTTLFLFRIEKSYESHSWKDVFSLSLLAALACLTRYVGVTLVIFYLSWLLFLKVEFRKKLAYGSAFLVTSLAPLLVWLYRNYILTGTLTGERGDSATPFFKNVGHTADTLSTWFLPASISFDTRIVLTGVIVILAVALYVRKNLQQISKSGIPQGILLNGGFTLTYVFYLLTVSSLVAFDQINHRLLAPVYIPLLIMTVSAIDQTSNLSTTKKSSATKVSYVLALLWICNLAYNAYGKIKLGLSDGAGGYSTTYWQESKLARYLSDNPPSGKVYSNFPDALYSLSGISASMSPRKHQYRATLNSTQDLEKLETELKSFDYAYLAWFDDAKRGYLFIPESLQTTFNLTVERELDDGTLYRISTIHK